MASVPKITQNIEQQGYKFREFEVEIDLFDGEAMLGDKQDEIHVDPQTGKIINIEADD